MLNKTGIEYGECSWNFYPGCLHKPQGICKVERCWAEGMSKRQRQDFHNPHLITEKLLEPLSRKKPTRILVNFMGDLFGDWVDPDMKIILPAEEASVWIDTVSLKNYVFQVIEHCPQHTFLFLTKNPLGLLPWSPFPDNCWVGVSATDAAMAWKAVIELEKVEAKVKYISFEPLLRSIADNMFYDRLVFRIVDALDWVIIGAQTKPTVMPKIEWVKEIVEACDKAKIPVFLKDNLKPIIPQPISIRFGSLDMGLRQELPSA